jgi:hypothetical protein
MEEQMPKNLDAMSVAYESVLDDLRKKEKGILLKKREDEFSKFGAPEQDWYKTKGTNFVAEMKKYDRFNNMKEKDKAYVNRLKDYEMY